MINAAIYCLTIFNILTIAFLIPRYFKISKIYQATFILVWAMHYVFGNIFVLITQDLTFTLASFSEFSETYFLGLVAGQYFLWAYLFLLDSINKPYVCKTSFRANANLTLTPLLLLTSVFALIFIYQIGIGAFFSRELAQNRINLGEYAGSGIGVYYYLATFLISATLLIGGYAIDHPRLKYISTAVIAFILVAIVFVPLGGRGRVFNVLIVVGLAFLLAQHKGRPRRMMNLRLFMVIGLSTVAALIWGLVRDLQSGFEFSLEWKNSIAALAIDTTRLPNQAFIFHNFSSVGTYFGLHYVEATLGPFYSMISSESAGLITEYSSLWYETTVSNFNQASAVSPSFIGEIYLNFGLSGVIISPLILFFIIGLMRRIGGRDHPLSTAVILYYFQILVFHGGLYTLFDVLVLVLPVFVAVRVLTNRFIPASA